MGKSGSTEKHLREQLTRARDKLKTRKQRYRDLSESGIASRSQEILKGNEDFWLFMGWQLELALWRREKHLEDGKNKRREDDYGIGPPLSVAYGEIGDLMMKLRCEIVDPVLAAWDLSSEADLDVFG